MFRISDAELQKINRSYRGDTNRVYRPAILADNDGVIGDPQLPGNVLIRTLGTNGLSVGRSVSLGDDQNIVWEANTPVRLGKDRQRRDSVIGSDTRGYMAAGINPVAIMQRNSSSSTPPSDFEMLRCVQSSPPSLEVSVKSWNPRVNGVYHLFGGATIDLTSAVPSTGDMLYAVIAVMADYATLEFAVSTARGVFDLALDETDINEAVALLTVGSTPVWAIKLIGDQTTITQADIDDDGQDLRDLVNNAEVGAGTVTSVALSVAPSSVFNVSGSPVTGAGTLALSMDNQNANVVLAGPSSGSAAAPAFRALVTDDLPVSAARTAFTQTNTVTVTNTTSETALSGTGVGSLTLAASALIAGRTLKLRAWGILSSLAVLPGTLNIKVKLGSTVILSTGAVTLTTSLSGALWQLDADITCRTTGGSGSVMGQGAFRTVNVLADIVEAMSNGTSTVTVDTTGSLAISVTATFGTADTGNTISCTNLSIEVLN